jgi:hypothetical protein
VGTGGAEILTRLAAAALVVAAPLALTACGGSKKTHATVAPSAAVQQAAKKTSAQSSEHMTLTGTVTAAGQQATVNGSGDFKGPDGTLHLTFGAGALRGSADAVLKGSALYVRSPLLATTLKHGKKWLKLKLGAAPGTIGGMPLSALAGESPTQALRQLGALQDVKDVGSEQIGGVQTTHYHGTLAATGTSPGGTYDVWVGSDGYVHRLRLTSKVAANEALNATIDLSDFGKSVTVTVPPASQTQTGG